MYKNRFSASGSALIFSLIIMLFMLVIAMGLFSVTILEKQTTGATGKSYEAFQLADSVAEDISNKLRLAYLKDSGAGLNAPGIGFSCASGGVVTGSVSGGTYMLYFKDGQDPAQPITVCSTDVTEVKLLKVVMTYKDTTRAIEVPVGGCLYNKPFSALTDGIGFWKLDELSSATKVRGGIGNIFDYTDSTALGSGVQTVNGVCGRAKQIPSGKKVQINNDSNLNFQDMATIDFWMRFSSFGPSSRPDYEELVGKYYQGAPDLHSYLVSMSVAEQKLSFGVTDVAGGPMKSVVSCYNIDSTNGKDKWLYVVAVFDRNNSDAKNKMILYVVGPTGSFSGTDSAECTKTNPSGTSYDVVKTTSPGGFTVNRPLYSNDALHFGDLGLTGIMDEIRISKKVKTQAEIEATYLMLAPNSQL